MIWETSGNLTEAESFHWSLPDEVPSMKVCIVGSGKMARLHLDTIKDMPGVVVSGIYSRGGATGEALAKEYAIPRVYRDWEEMIKAESPDALIVAVANEVVTQVYAKVLTYGIPCLLEKPVGFSVEETSMLAGIAVQHNTRAMVAVNRRFYSNLKQALLEINRLGPVKGILVETNEPIIRYRTRLQFDKWVYDKWVIAQSLHLLDLIRLVCGEPMKVDSIIREGSEGLGEAFVANMEFENGALGTFSCVFNSPGYGIKIFGHGVTAELYPLEEGFLSYSTGRRIKLGLAGIDRKYKQGLFEQNTYFFHCIARGLPFRFPASDIQDHLKSMQLIERLIAGTNS